MKITADVSKICKTDDFRMIFDVLLGSAIGFVSFLVSWAVKSVVSFT